MLLRRQVLSLHELPSALPALGWLADPHKQLPPLPEDGVSPPTIDEGLHVRHRPCLHSEALSYSILARFP